MRIALIVNLSKENAISTAVKIARFMRGEGCEVFAHRDCLPFFNDNAIEYADSTQKLFLICDIAVTVGGDGTIIHAAKYAARADKPLIGVNLGRLGFVADVEPDEIGELKKLLTGGYTSEERILLDVEVSKPDGTEKYLAVNDAVVTHGQLSKIVDFYLYHNGEEISRFRADGVLFSTPTGSTAYSLSAGGPVVSPGMDCLLMTPVCPHSLFSRPVLFVGEDVLSVRVKIPDGCSCVLTVDGEKNISVAETDTVIIRKSALRLTLLSIKNHNFYTKLNEKLKKREL